MVANPTTFSAVYEHDPQNPTQVGGIRVRFSGGVGVSVKIQRWDSTSQLYADLATVTASIGQYFDTSISGGMSYAYRFLSVDAGGGTPTFYTAGTAPVLVINRPAAATDVESVARPDDSIDVTWTEHATILAPIYRSYIFRRSTSAGDEGQVDHVDGDDEFYRDNRTAIDTGYRHRIWGTNGQTGGGAYFMSPWSNWSYTTPLSPADFVAYWDGSDVRLRWSLPSTIANGVLVEHSADGVDWHPLADLGRATGHVHEDPERGVDHHWRVTALAPEPAEGARKQSSPVTVTMPANLQPLAPIIEGPTHAPPGNVELEVRHRPVDGTPMSEAKSEYRLGSEGAWVAVAGLTLPLGSFGTGTAVQVRAYTRGSSAQWSPASPVHTLTLRNAPSPPTITGPTSPVPALSFTASWTTPGTQHRARVVLEQDSVIIAEQEVTTAKSVTLTGENQQNYRLGVSWFDGVMWSPTAWRNLSIAVAGPPAPSLSAEVDVADATVDLTVAAGVEVYRVGIGERVLVTTGPGADLVPPLGREFTYVARAYSSGGGWTDSEPVAVSLPGDRVIINYGDDLSGKVWAAANPSLTDSISLPKELHDFGRGYPVRFEGTDTGRHVQQVRITLLGGDDEMNSSRESWKQLQAPRPGRPPLRTWYRSPDGESWLASIDGLSMSTEHDQWAQVSFTATRISA